MQKIDYDPSPEWTSKIEDMLRIDPFALIIVNGINSETLRKRFYRRNIHVRVSTNPNLGCVVRGTGIRPEPSRINIRQKYIEFLEEQPRTIQEISEEFQIAPVTIAWRMAQIRKKYKVGIS